MDLYEILKFLHIVAATLWVGGGFAMILASTLAARRGGTLAMARTSAELGGVLFMPASLATLVLGVALTAMAWSFAELWILIALGGIAISIGIGALVIKPTSDRIAALVETDGPNSAVAEAKAIDLMRTVRFDAVVMMVVVADMVFKPTADDVVVLALMGLAVASGALVFLVFQPRPAAEATA